MQLVKGTVNVAEFDIGSPRWNGDRTHKIVGLALWRLNKHNVIRFTYRHVSDGQLSIPGTYYFDGEKYNPVKYQHQEVKGTKLVLVPFSDLEVLESES